MIISFSTLLYRLSFLIKIYQLARTSLATIIFHLETTTTPPIAHKRDYRLISRSICQTFRSRTTKGRVRCRHRKSITSKINNSTSTIPSERAIRKLTTILMNEQVKYRIYQRFVKLWSSSCYFNPSLTRWNEGFTTKTFLVRAPNERARRFSNVLS